MFSWKTFLHVHFEPEKVKYLKKLRRLCEMNKYNVIIVMLDSFRQDHISFYNKGERVFKNVTACRTPNLDKFARESIAFHNAYPAGLPTIPVRAELMTGHFTLPYKPWTPMYPTEITIAGILKREGYISGLITDTYHLFKPGMNFHKDFDSFIWIRGQEYDAFNSAPLSKKNVENYVNKSYTEYWKKLVTRFLANTEDFKNEEDWFSAKVFSEATKWLRKNRVHERIFLWVDSFDPHEPWDPPEKFDVYTSKSYNGKRLILPMGGEARSWASEEEIDYIRGLYAGEASSVDYWFGMFYEELKELGFLEDSVIVVLADHGHPLADHGKFLKGTDRLYNELLKVPFMIRLPGGEKARETKAIVQFPDILPTILELIGLGNNISSMHGKSFLQVLLNQIDEHRKYAISGYYESVERCIHDQEWSYIQRPEGQSDELYSLVRDPKETKNLIDENLDEAKRLALAFGTYFKRAESKTIKGIQGKYELS
jgi:arylsulfatase A-like enzyme